MRFIVGLALSFLVAVGSAVLLGLWLGWVILTMRWMGAL